MVEEPKVFAIDWQRDYDALSVDLFRRAYAEEEGVDLWVMLTRTTQFHSSVAVPVGYWELETIGL